MGGSNRSRCTLVAREADTRDGLAGTSLRRRPGLP